MTSKFALLLLLTATACVSKETNPDQLILPWTESMASSEAPLPFLAKYKRDGKEIHYLAAAHANNVDHQTFKMIVRSLRTYAPEVFLLEGFESEMGYSPEEIRKSSLADGVGGRFNNGESAFAAQFAIRQKIPFKGVEPSKAQIFEALQKEKYTAQDMIHFYFLRQIPQWIRAGTLNSSQIEKTFANYSKQLAKNMKVDVDLTYKDFLVWYKSKNKEEFTLKNIDAEKTAPLITGQYYTQKLSSTIGRVRDRHMIVILSEELAHKDRVFMVIGGSHWMTQKLALEALSGFPTMEFKEN